MAGVPVGQNHSQRGYGVHRHERPETLAWGGAVWAAVFAAARAANLTGRDAWGVRWDGTGHALAVRLHFYVSAERVQDKLLKEQWLRKLDVDAPAKLTLDRTMAALQLDPMTRLSRDDHAVRRLEVVQTVIEDLPRPGGYGKTRQGCWIEIRRLSAADVRKIDAEQPGAPG